jgi:hypothetical protein
MDSIDKLLAELKSEYEQPLKPQQQSKPSPSKPHIQPEIKSASSLIDNILADVKSDFEERDQVLELQKRQELEQERIRQEQLQAKQLETLNKYAQDWLEKLDPLSTEGIWFESFAEGYPSKLEAAIEYLQSC